MGFNSVSAKSRQVFCNSKCSSGNLCRLKHLTKVFCVPETKKKVHKNICRYFRENNNLTFK